MATLPEPSADRPVHSTLRFSDMWSPRASWNEVPTGMRSDIEDLLGSKVVEAQNQSGGFSPGLAARLRCADGSTAFVKAVGAELNPDTPDLHRQEARIARALPPELPVPTLRGSFDDGRWVALVFDDISGRIPAQPWRADELADVLREITALTTALTPSPAEDLPSAVDHFGERFGSYRVLADDLPALTSWERRNLDALAELSEGSVHHLGGETLLHLDLRADNLLVGDDGVVHFVDWPWAARGAPWIDVTMFLVSVAIDGYDSEALLAAHPLYEGVDPGHVTGFLAGFAGLLAERSRWPAPPGLPHLRTFQRAHQRAALNWLRRRTSWP